eukprot:CAMPEP_0117543658 /NCGR_PEP_ID=MMETSP0784-20121206/45172_1 /TAXON_ID=39447 /ORGANISM="" /LENGTH=64 /DNA_ID=CAMNT_0005340439 /DNA_START=164 /DNA_END=359 /DNA_ORIENTATION=+
MLDLASQQDEDAAVDNVRRLLREPPLPVGVRKDGAATDLGRLGSGQPSPNSAAVRHDTAPAVGK